MCVTANMSALCSCALLLLVTANCLLLQLSSSDNILSINLSELDCDDDEPATSGN
jgi:hypothetical protein